MGWCFMKNFKKNILFVVDERRMGGVSILLEDILKTINIDKYNIDVLVLHNNGEMLENLPKSVNLIYGTPYFNAIDYTYKELLIKKDIKLLFRKFIVVFDMKTGLIEKKIRRERKKILNKQYDIEIAFKDGFTALFTIFGDSKKKIHWLQYEYRKTNPNAKYDKLFKKILPKFDKIIAVSEDVKNAFNDIYHLDNKTSVIHNLVDINKIKINAKEKTDILFNKNDFNAISIGRLHYSKGYVRLIEAIRKLNEEKLLPKNFKLRIYGNGPEHNNLMSKIEKYKLGSLIFLMGQTTNPYKYLKNSDLFILSSVHESFGLVIVEAMTLRIPVLATENSATSTIIKHKFNGYITENSEEGIYNGLKYLFSNIKELDKYRDNLKNYRYDNTKIIKQIEDVLDK